MNKIKMIKVLFLVSLLTCGCGKKDNYESKKIYLSSSDVSSTEDMTTIITEDNPHEVEFFQESTNFEEISDNYNSLLENSYSMPDTDDSFTMKNDWCRAYRLVLDEFKVSADYNDYSMWDLIDIDQNGIPELIISPNEAHADGVLVYCYVEHQAIPVATDEGGNPIKFGEFGVGIFCSDDGYGYIGSFYQKGGNAYNIYYRFSDGLLTKEMTTFSNAADGNMPLRFELNDIEVTEEEFQTAVEIYDSKEWEDAGRKFMLDDYSILELAEMIPAEFNEEQLQMIKRSLGVPEDMNVVFRQGKSVYMRMYNRWRIYVQIINDDYVVASAGVNPENLELTDSVLTYEDISRLRSNLSFSYKKQVSEDDINTTETSPLN